MIVEVVQAQPAEFAVGYCSGRIWINGTGMSRTYFSDFGSGKYLFKDMNNVEIMICARREVNALDIAAFFGKYDVMNVMWFKGSEGVYASTDGKFRFF